MLVMAAPRAYGLLLFAHECRALHLTVHFDLTESEDHGLVARVLTDARTPADNTIGPCSGSGGGPEHALAVKASRARQMIRAWAKRLSKETLKTY